MFLHMVLFQSFNWLSNSPLCVDDIHNVLYKYIFSFQLSVHGHLGYFQQ